MKNIIEKAKCYAEKFTLEPQTSGWFKQKVDDFSAGYEEALRDNKFCNLEKTKTIRTQKGLTQFDFMLKSEDADILMIILKRNNIWFSDITDYDKS